jgi:hypothetical protein
MSVTVMHTPSDAHHAHSSTDAHAVQLSKPAQFGIAADTSDSAASASAQARVTHTAMRANDAAHALAGSASGEPAAHAAPRSTPPHAACNCAHNNVGDAASGHAAASATSWIQQRGTHQGSCRPWRASRGTACRRSGPARRRSGSAAWTGRSRSPVWPRTACSWPPPPCAHAHACQAMQNEDQRVLRCGKSRRRRRRRAEPRSRRRIYAHTGATVRACACGSGSTHQYDASMSSLCASQEFPAATAGGRSAARHRAATPTPSTAHDTAPLRSDDWLCAVRCADGQPLPRLAAKRNVICLRRCRNTCTVTQGQTTQLCWPRKESISKR